MADNLSQKPPKPGENSKVGNAGTVGGNETMRIGEVDRVVNHPTCLTSGTAINQRKKAPSFQITSVSVGSNSRTSNDGGDDSADDLDESHTDDFSIDNSRITDVENETPSFSEDTFSKDEIYFNPSNPSLTSVPVIPTSSQYGLAIVGTDTENNTNNANLINAAVVCANNISAGDASVTVTETGNVINLIPNTKSDIEMRDHSTHHASRNERFKVVKIESTEPFKRGRWMCMDYLDHTILQQQQSQLSGIGVKDSDTSVGTAHFIAPESNVVISSDNLLIRGQDEQADPSYKSLGQDNHLVNQQGTVNLITGQALPSFPNISPGQSLQHDLQQIPVSNTQSSVNPQLQQVNPQLQQVNSSSQQSSAQSQPINNQSQSTLPLGSQPLSLQSQQITSQVQQTQQVNSQNQQINPNSQVNQHIQQQFNSQTMNPQSQQFNPQSQQTGQAQNQGMIGQSQQQINPQTPQVNQQISQPQHFNSQSSHMSSQPQQFNSQTQQFNQQSSHQLHQGSTQQNINQIQPNLQGQNFQSSSTQQVSQAQSMTQVPIQCATSMPTGQALQHQSLPPQQLQQVLNAVNMQQMSVQQGLVQPQHMMHQGMNQFQHQSTQYYGQGGIQMLPPQSGMAPSNSMASVTLQHPPSVQSSASMPLPIPNSGTMTSQITRQQQMSVPSQQQQQAQIQQQMQMQQMATRQTQSLQQIPMQQQQTVPMQAQYSVQQQFPMQHQQQFPVQQQFSVQQQIPLVQLYPVQQQQQVPMQSPQVPLQQQILQQNYQPLPNMQQSGQIMTRNLPSGDCPPAPQGHNVNQSGLIQGSQIPPGLHQNYIHQVPTSSQSEPFFTAANSRSEQQITAPRNVNAGAGDAANSSSVSTIFQAGSLSSSTSRSEVSEQTLMEVLPLVSEVDVPATAEDHPVPTEDPESLNGLARALATSGRHICRPRGGLPPASSSSSSPDDPPSTLSPPPGHPQGHSRATSPVPLVAGDAERHSASGTSAVAIDNKIEQAMDLVKSHLMFAVREEVEVLKEKIAELMERISQLEVENNLLRAHAPPDVVASLPQPPSGNPPSSQPPSAAFPPNGSVS